MFLVITAASFHTKDSTNRKSLTKSQPCLTSFNSLDIASSKAKKGKEKEIAKLKRPTALKKVNQNLGCLFYRVKKALDLCKSNCSILANTLLQSVTRQQKDSD